MVLWDEIRRARAHRHVHGIGVVVFEESNAASRLCRHYVLDPKTCFENFCFLLVMILSLVHGIRIAFARWSHKNVLGQLGNLQDTAFQTRVSEINHLRDLASSSNFHRKSNSSQPCLLSIIISRVYNVYMVRVGYLISPHRPMLAVLFRP